MEESIHISELLDIIKNKWKIVVATTAIFVVIAAIFSCFIITPKYETTVKLFVGKNSTKHSVASYDSSEVMMYQKLISTYADVVQTNDLIESALKSSKVNLKPKDVLNSLTVTPVTDTQILEISYKDSDKYRAVTVINAITKEFINKAKILIPNSNVQVLEKAYVPLKPVSPHKVINIVIALILGIVVGIGGVLILEFMDNTFKSKEELEKVLGIPVIGVITEFSNQLEENSNRRKV